MYLRHDHVSIQAEGKSSYQIIPFKTQSLKPVLSFKAVWFTQRHPFVNGLVSVIQFQLTPTRFPTLSPDPRLCLHQNPWSFSVSRFQVSSLFSRNRYSKSIRPPRKRRIVTLSPHATSKWREKLQNLKSKQAPLGAAA